MGPNPADPLAVIYKITSFLLGAAFAQAAAPHIGILFAGAIGSVFGMMAWRKCTRLEAFGYMALFTCVAWLFAGLASVIISTLARKWVPWLDSAEPLLLAVAMAIATVGHRWPLIFDWGMRRWITRAPADQGPQP